MSEYLVKLDNATRMLAECKNPIDALAVMALADAAEAWAKTLRLGDEAERYAREIKCDAKRKLGEMLRSSERAKGTRVKGGTTGGPVVEPPANDAPTLADLGISKKLSAESQVLASLPEEQYQEVKRKKTERKPAPKKTAERGSHKNWIEYIEKAETILSLLKEMEALKVDKDRVFQARRLMEKMSASITRILKLNQ